VVFTAAFASAFCSFSRSRYRLKLQKNERAASDRHPEHHLGGLQEWALCQERGEFHIEIEDGARRRGAKGLAMAAPELYTLADVEWVVGGAERFTDGNVAVEEALAAECDVERVDEI